MVDPDVASGKNASSMPMRHLKLSKRSFLKWGRFRFLLANDGMLTSK